jgi:hypothetical protein
MTPIRGLLVKGVDDATDAAAPVIEDAVKKSSSLLGRAKDYVTNNPWKTATGATALGVAGSSIGAVAGSPSIPNPSQSAANQNNAAPSAAASAAGNDTAPQYASPTLMAPAMMRSVARNMRDNTPATTALPTQSVAQRQQYVDPDKPGSSSMDAFNEALAAAGRAAAGNGFAGVLGAGVAMKLGAMKASAGMSDQKRYQQWVSAINENVARRNTETMTQAQQNNAMALSNAQLMQGNERLRMDSANAYNSAIGGLANTAAYTDQNAINLANNQYNALYKQHADDRADKVAAGTQALRSAWGSVLANAPDGKLQALTAGANAALGHAVNGVPSGYYSYASMANPYGGVPVENSYPQY